MTEPEIFIEGWKKGLIRAITEIEIYSSPWLPNGPSKATADAILKKIKSLPIPRVENGPVSDTASYNGTNSKTETPREQPEMAREKSGI